MARAFVVGYDGSAASRDALRLAERLGRAASARVIAVNVQEEGEQPEPGEGDVDARVVSAGSVAQGLEATAEQEGASVIAIGASKRRGRVRGELMADLRRELLVVPEGTAPDLPKRVAAVVDGGQALEVGAALARRFDARLAMISASGDDATPDVAFARRVEERIERDLRDALGGEGPKVDADLTIVSGPAGPAVAQAAHDDVDMLVADAPGDVADHLTRQPPCPVLAVPQGFEAG